MVGSDLWFPGRSVRDEVRKLGNCGGMDDL